MRELAQADPADVKESEIAAGTAAPLTAVVSPDRKLRLKPLFDTKARFRHFFSRRYLAGSFSPLRGDPCLAGGWVV